MDKNYVQSLTEQDLLELRFKFVDAFRGDIIGVRIKRATKLGTLNLTLFFEDAKIGFVLTEYDCKIREAHRKLISKQNHLLVYQTWFDFMKSKDADYIDNLNHDVLARYDK